MNAKKKQTYTLNNGDTVSIDILRDAFANGTLRLVHCYGEGKTITGLTILADDEDDFDTRGETYSVWDAAWTQVPKSIGQALRYG